MHKVVAESKLKNEEKAGLSEVNPFFLPISFALKHHRKARFLNKY